MDSKHGLPVAGNLLDRNFTPATPKQVWTSDIPYLWTDEGRLYLAIVLDLFTREVIGWSLKPRMTMGVSENCVLDSLPCHLITHKLQSIVCKATLVRFCAALPLPHEISGLGRGGARRQGVLAAVGVDMSAGEEIR
jgi:hypothetical protein